MHACMHACIYTYINIHTFNTYVCIYSYVFIYVCIIYVLDGQTGQVPWVEPIEWLRPSVADNLFHLSSSRWTWGIPGVDHPIPGRLPVQQLFDWAEDAGVTHFTAEDLAGMLAEVGLRCGTVTFWEYLGVRCVVLCCVVCVPLP